MQVDCFVLARRFDKLFYFVLKYFLYDPNIFFFYFGIVLNVRWVWKNVTFVFVVHSTTHSSIGYGTSHMKK